MAEFATGSTIDGFGADPIVYPSSIAGVDDILDAPLLHQLSYPQFGVIVEQASLFWASDSILKREIHPYLRALHVHSLLHHLRRVRNFYFRPRSEYFLCSKYEIDCISFLGLSVNSSIADYPDAMLEHVFASWKEELTSLHLESPFGLLYSPLYLVQYVVFRARTVCRSSWVNHVGASRHSNPLANLSPIAEL